MLVPLLAAGLRFAYADQPVTRTQQIELNTGDTLIVASNRTSIQQVVLQGNLSATHITNPGKYPTNEFQFQSQRPGSYELQINFNFPQDYVVNLFVKSSVSMSQSNATYYMSGGSLELDLTASFNAPPNDSAAFAPSMSPWDSFVDWIGKFSQAFPFWVKLLYLILGLQFVGVGGLWIRRETRKKETTAQRLDIGDKLYLWLDVVYKFLLVSLGAIVAIMGGELVILFILRFMFLVTINLLSLWDLFVVGFAAGAVIMVYLMRFTLEKAFDLKPVEDE